MKATIEFDISLFGIYFVALLNCAFRDVSSDSFIFTWLDGSVFNLAHLRPENNSSLNQAAVGAALEALSETTLQE